MPCMHNRKKAKLRVTADRNEKRRKHMELAGRSLDRVFPLELG